MIITSLQNLVFLSVLLPWVFKRVLSCDVLLSIIVIQLRWVFLKFSLNILDILISPFLSSSLFSLYCRLRNYVPCCRFFYPYKRAKPCKLASIFKHCHFYLESPHKWAVTFQLSYILLVIVSGQLYSRTITHVPLVLGRNNMIFELRLSLIIITPLPNRHPNGY